MPDDTSPPDDARPDDEPGSEAPDAEPTGSATGPQASGTDGPVDTPAATGAAARKIDPPVAGDAGTGSDGDAERSPRTLLIAAAVAVIAVLVLAGALIARSGGPETKTAASSPSPTSTPATAKFAPLTVPATTTLATDPGTTAESTPPPSDFSAIPTVTFATKPTDPPNTFPLPPAPYRVAVPKANGPFPIYAAVNAQPAKLTLDNPHLVVPGDPNTGVPLHLLVRGDAGPDWIEVYLPVRPNGSTGFVRKSDVMLSSHSYHIEVRLSQYSLKVFNGATLVMDAPIAVASNNTPTPGGLYYTTELIQPPDQNGPYGHYAYGLSGFSDVFQSFGGGPGQIGIHGTNDPSSIGRNVSHGCIRMRNSDIEQLVPMLPLGVPVAIYP